MRRGVVWAFTLPLVAGSVLTAHWLAYALTGAPAAEVHGYLAHAPQLVVVLSTLAVCALALQGRARASAPTPFATVALAAFVAQEHVERLVHAGELPWLLTRPEFLLGLVLQLPAALLVWLLARFLLAVDPVSPTRPRRLPSLFFEPLGRLAGAVTCPAPVGVTARGPPVLP